MPTDASTLTESRRGKTGIKKPGSGRTKGAVSIVTVSLADLNRTFANPQMRIAVSRKFIEGFGIPYQLMEGQTPPVETPTEEPPVIKPDASKKPSIRTVDFSKKR